MTRFLQPVALLQVVILKLFQSNVPLSLVSLYLEKVKGISGSKGSIKCILSNLTGSPQWKLSHFGVRENAKSGDALFFTNWVVTHPLFQRLILLPLSPTTKMFDQVWH